MTYSNRNGQISDSFRIRSEYDSSAGYSGEQYADRRWNAKGVWERDKHRHGYSRFVHPLIHFNFDKNVTTNGLTNPVN